MTSRRVVALAMAAVTVLMVTSLSSAAGAFTIGSGAQVFSPPSSIASDCSVDVTKALYDWINTLPQGTSAEPTEVQFASGGCYQVDGMLFLRGLTNFIFDGNGAVFRQDSIVDTALKGDPPPKQAPYCGSHKLRNAVAQAPTQFDIMWFVEGGCDLVFENMNIVGTNLTGNPGSDLEQDSAMQLAGVQQVLVTGNVIEGPWGDFVTVSGLHEAGFGGMSYPSTDVTIADNYMDASGRQGITVVYGDRVTVDSNTIANVADSAIDLEAETPGGSEANILVENNTIHGYEFLLAGITGAALSDVELTGNTVSQTRIDIDPTTKTPAQNITIEGNTANASTLWSMSYDIFFGDVSNALVSQNTAPLDPPAGAFVHLAKNTSAVAVQDNTLNPGPGAPSNFEPVPLAAKNPSQGTDCDNTTSSGTDLDSNENPPTLDQCSTTTPTTPTPAALPSFVSS